MHHVLAHRQLDVDARRLEDDADQTTNLLRLAYHVVATDRGAPAGRGEQGGEDPEQRGLAAAVRSEQAEDLAAPHAEREVDQRQRVAIAVTEALDRENLVLRHGARGRERAQNGTLSKVMSASSAGR